MKEFALGLIGIATSLLYLVGYVYLSGFYDVFGITINELGFGIEDIIVNSYPVIKEAAAYPWSLLSNLSTCTLVLSLVALLIGFAAYLYFGKPERTRFGPAFRALAFSALFVVAGILLYLAAGAGALGRDKAEVALTSFRQVYFSALDGTDPTANFLVSSDELIYRLIISTEDTVFIYAEQGGTEFRWTIRLPRERSTAILTFREEQPTASGG